MWVSIRRGWLILSSRRFASCSIQDFDLLSHFHRYDVFCTSHEFIVNDIDGVRICRRIMNYGWFLVMSCVCVILEMEHIQDGSPWAMWYVFNCNL
jgi:hypothetical protein